MGMLMAMSMAGQTAKDEPIKKEVVKEKSETKSKKSKKD